MTMMHLRFPSRKGFFSWEELSIWKLNVANAISQFCVKFPGYLFSKHVPEELTKEKGVTIKSFIHMLREEKLFSKYLDQTFNLHTDEWNLSVIHRAAYLLDQHVVSFEELHAIRLAFQVYESANTKGLPLNQHQIQRALKMCDRMISPLKMMHRIKHMRDSFEEEDHIQLHEFLDLLLWCDTYEEPDKDQGGMTIHKDNRNLYPIDNFEEFLIHHDEKLAQKLNNGYITQEWKFTKVKHGSKRMPRDVPPVDPEIRKRQVLHHKKRYQHLQGQVTESQDRVSQAQAGYVRQRPLSAPELIHCKSPCDKQTGINVKTDERPPTVMELAGHLIRPLTPESSPLIDATDTAVRPVKPEYCRQQTPEAVPSRDREISFKEMEALKFQMETIEMKYRQILNESLDMMLPGYRDRVQEPPPQTPETIEKVAVVKEERPSQETLSRLARPKDYGVPSPLHAKLCDARFRGWHKVKTTQGDYRMLVTPSYEGSPRGQMLQKLAESAHSSKEHCSPYLYRRYKSSSRVLDQTRPKTSPASLMRSAGSSRKKYSSNHGRAAGSAGTTHSKAESSTKMTDSQAPPINGKNERTSCNGRTGESENGGRNVSEMRKARTLSVMDSIPETEFETIKHAQDEDDALHSSQDDLDDYRGQRSVKVAALGVTDGDTFNYLPRSGSKVWMREILSAPYVEKQPEKIESAFIRLSKRARNFCSPELEERLVISH